MGSRRLDSRPQTGRAAEDLAASLLQKAGFTIVERNWRRPQGELDIVAADGGTCVFVEVRSRTGTELGHPLESVTPAKRAQVIRAARLYLAEAASPASAYRFDVVAVTFDPEGRAPPEVLHLPGAFETD
jgi:putative endonuclease